MTENSCREDRSRRRRRHLYPEEAKRLLTTALDETGVNAERNFVLLSLALNAGLRVSEVSALNLSDFRDEAFHGAPLVIVRRGKGGVAREVFISPEMAERLRSYVEKRRGVFGSDGPMFSSRWQGHIGKRLRERAIEYIFTNAAADAGIDPGFSFHSLRHTFATFYYRTTRDLEGLSRQLGHSSIETTAIYARIEDADHDENMRRFGEMVR